MDNLKICDASGHLCDNLHITFLCSTTTTISLQVPMASHFNGNHLEHSTMPTAPLGCPLRACHVTHNPMQTHHITDQPLSPCPSPH